MHFLEFYAFVLGVHVPSINQSPANIFWQCKNKLSYKISTKMVMNIFNSYLEKNKLCYEISYKL